MIYNIVVGVLMTLIRVLKRPGYIDPVLSWRHQF